MLLIRLYYKDFFISKANTSKKKMHNAFRWRDGKVYLPSGKNVLQKGVDSDDFVVAGLPYSISDFLAKVISFFHVDHGDDLAARKIAIARWRHLVHKPLSKRNVKQVFVREYKPTAML